MNREQYDAICNKAKTSNPTYIHLVSWALWGDDLEDLSMFDSSNLNDTIPKLKDDVVLMGLNASDSANAKKEDWACFHNRHRGGRDSWIRELTINDSTKDVITGAYMTDVFKLVKSKSKEVKKEVKDETMLKKQFAILNEELSLLGDDPLIILFGKDAFKYFKKFAKENLNKSGKEYRYVGVLHYAAPGKRKNDFRNSVEKELDKLKLK